MNILDTYKKLKSQITGFKSNGVVFIYQLFMITSWACIIIFVGCILLDAFIEPINIDFTILNTFLIAVLGAVSAFSITSLGYICSCQKSSDENQTQTLIGGAISNNDNQVK